MRRFLVGCGSFGFLVVASCAVSSGCSSSDSPASDGAGGSAGSAGAGGSAGSAGAGGSAGTGGSAGSGGSAGTGGSAGAGGSDAGDPDGSTGSDASSPAACTTPSPTGACDTFLPGTSTRMCVEYYEVLQYPVAQQQSDCAATAGSNYIAGGGCPTAGDIGHCVVALKYAPPDPVPVKGLHYYDSSLLTAFEDSCNTPGAAGSTKTWCGP